MKVGAISEIQIYIYICIYGEGWEGGISVGGRKISNLRYADDTTLFAASEQELAELFSRVEKESELVGLSINKAKTKVLVIDTPGTLTRSNELRGLEFVDQFIYLGSLLNSEGDSGKEIARRIQMSKAAMTKLTRIWKDRNVSRKTKVRLVQTLVFSIFFYGAESWTIKQRERAKIDAFEMWCWRRMLRIPWTARRTNISILEELGITTRLSAACFQRILKYFGHIARRNPDSLEKLMVVGQVDGKRPRGRSPTRWSDLVKKLTGQPVSKAIKTAEDRITWKSIVHRVVNSSD